ncbi:MAG TPA: redoxin domain-containing protein [Candidatus Angelobacter sp.]|nr:redoxin domain-containing protein [Candidatus Angelobacter sp.]
MNRNLLFFTVALLLCVAASEKLWPRGLQDANHTSSSGPEKGATAPDFTLKVVDGKGQTMQLSSLQGKAVLVNFWATWCEPCKIEMPWLAELQKKYGPEGLQIIGVAVDDSGEKNISGFARKLGVNYPVLQGTEKVADMYGGVEGLPMSFFIDRSGKVSDKILGLVSESVIEDAIKKSLEQKGDTKTAAGK